MFRLIPARIAIFQGFFAPLVDKGGQLAPYIVGTLLEQSKSF